MLQSMFLLLSLTLGLLLLSQKKQFEFRLQQEQSQSQHWESEFQRLRDLHLDLVSKNQLWESRFQELHSDLERESALVLRLNQELAKQTGSVQERAKALEWGLQ